MFSTNVLGAPGVVLEGLSLGLFVNLVILRDSEVLVTRDCVPKYVQHPLLITG